MHARLSSYHARVLVQLLIANRVAKVSINCNSAAWVNYAFNETMKYDTSTKSLFFMMIGWILQAWK